MASVDALSSILAHKIKRPTTYKALIVLGLQDDILDTTINRKAGSNEDFVPPILDLVPKWRDRAGYVVWIKLTQSSDNDLPKQEKDVGRFFGNLGNMKNATNQKKIPSDLISSAKSLIDEKQDIILDAPYASKSTSNSFLATLRAEMITEVFICGCLVDSAGFSIMYDTARQAFQTYVIEDCLGYKDQKTHDMLIKYAKEEMCTEGISSKYILDDLNAPREENTTTTDLQNTLDALSLRNRGSPLSSPSTELSPSASAAKSKKPKPKTKVQTRSQQRKKDLEAIRERQRITQMLLADPYSANDTLTEASRTNAAVSSTSTQPPRDDSTKISSTLTQSTETTNNSTIPSDKISKTQTTAPEERP